MATVGLTIRHWLISVMRCCAAHVQLGQFNARALIRGCLLRLVLPFVEHHLPCTQKLSKQRVLCHVVTGQATSSTINISSHSKMQTATDKPGSNMDQSLSFSLSLSPCFSHHAGHSYGCCALLMG
jgi:hypothetical protein